MFITHRIINKMCSNGIIKEQRKLFLPRNNHEIGLLVIYVISISNSLSSGEGNLLSYQHLSLNNSQRDGSLRWKKGRVNNSQRDGMDDS